MILNLREFQSVCFRCVVLLAIGAWSFDRSAWLGAAEPLESPEKAAAIRLMHDEAAKLEVKIERGAETVTADLKPQAILHYSDPQRAFPDATLWAWTVAGQPTAFLKLERIHGATPHLQYCIGVVSLERLSVRWGQGVVWKPQRAGLKFQSLKETEAPQQTAPLRLAQFRNLARRFRAAKTEHEGDREEMRLLAQPILRYSNPETSPMDGAVFAFVSNGTNPDALLLIQIRSGAKEAPPMWEYSCLAMSGDAVKFHLDGDTVFNHPGADGPGDHGHWLWVLLPVK